MSLGSGLLSKQKATKPHLTRGTGGIAGEVADLRADLENEVAALCGLVVEEFTNPAAADADAIKTSIASAATQQVYQGAALNGVVGAGVMSPPRNLTITTTTHADIDAVAVAIEGEDINGDPITESITLTDGGGVTDVGAKAFAKVTKITVPAQGGTGGALTFGFGAIIGLGKKIRVRAGTQSLIKEHAAGAVVTNGVLANPTTGAPNGTYAPNSAPDGARDYAVWYEADFS